MHRKLFFRILMTAFVLSGYVSTSVHAQRTWHLVGDSVGTTDYIGSNNAQDFRIKTDSAHASQKDWREQVFTNYM